MCTLWCGFTLGHANIYSTSWKTCFEKLSSCPSDLQSVAAHKNGVKPSGDWSVLLKSRRCLILNMPNGSDIPDEASVSSTQTDASVVVLETPWSYFTHAVKGIFLALFFFPSDLLFLRLPAAMQILLHHIIFSSLTYPWVNLQEGNL